jgi:hypothetical protein
VFDLDTDVDRQGATLAHTLSTTGNPPAPVVPAMAERRKNGDILLVSRDVTNIFRIRKAIINAFAMGGAFCQATGIAVGLAIGVRQMRRVRGIRHAAHRARSSHPACTCRFFLCSMSQRAELVKDSQFLELVARARSDTGRLL